jgi:hypothetical protein
MGAPLAVQERITDSRTIRRAVALMEELTGYHFRPRAAEATLPKLRVLGKAVSLGVELPSLPHYGNVRIVDFRWELRIGESYPATPTIIFGKAPQILSPIARALSTGARLT